MRKSVFAIAAIGMMLLSGCGLGTVQQLASGLTTGTTGTTTSTTSTTTTSTTSSSSSILDDLLGHVIGEITGTNSSVVGTWVYEQPAVEFTSSNVLAQVGGKVAAQAAVDKLAPYYQKLGITAGAMTITFSEDNTCTVTALGKTNSGKYSYDSSNNKLTITLLTGKNVELPGSCSVSGNYMLYTFNADKILSVATNLASSSSSSSLSTIASLAKSFDGMQAGFTFVKK